MLNFSFEDTQLKDAKIIEGFSAGDNRGGFTKTFEKNIYLCAGIQFELNETFVSVSSGNVVRGMHFQLHRPQAKLVSVCHGSVYDVIVDLRPYSSTYKQWCGYTLSADNHRVLYVPKGFAHGFLALEDDSVMLYQCEGEYDKNTDTGIRFDDPAIGIKWPTDNYEDLIISARDMALMSFEEYEKHPMEI